jgi:hypothetical protein
MTGGRVLYSATGTVSKCRPEIPLATFKEIRPATEFFGAFRLCASCEDDGMAKDLRYPQVQSGQLCNMQSYPQLTGSSQITEHNKKILDLFVFGRPLLS